MVFANPLQNTAGAVKALGISSQQQQEYEAQQQQATASPLQSALKQVQSTTQTQQGATAPTVQAPSSSNITLSTNTVFGNILNQVDEVVEIPLFGSPDSLNVAVAGSLFLYEWAKQSSYQEC